MSTPRLLGSKMKGNFLVPFSTLSRVKHSHYGYGSLKHAAVCVQICRKFRQNSQHKTFHRIENSLKKIYSNNFPDIVGDTKTLFHKSVLKSSYNVILSGCWDRYARNSDENENENENENDSDSDSDPERNRKVRNMLIGTLIGALIVNSLLIKSPFNQSKSKETSWNVFLRLMLQTGEVERLTVSEKTKNVYVYLRPGAVINGEQISPTYIPPYYFKIGNLRTFEEKLNKAQSDLGIKPIDYIPVNYIQPPNVGHLFLFLFLLLSIGLPILLLAKKGSRSTGRSSSIFKSMRMTSAKTTIIKPGSKKGAVSMKDVAGMTEAKEEIKEFIEFLKDPERFKELGAKMPKGALLTGPPGTGKTLLAKAISTEAGVPFISMAGSDFIEMIGGLGAARVRDLFKQAHELAPCIIFIDEIDAVGKKRGNNYNGGGEYDQTLNQLLVEMDGMNTATDVIMLASTNRSDILDDALLRPGRFDRKITIDLPNLPERREIFEIYLRKLKLSRKEDLFEYYAKRLAELTPGKSGADIASICNEAGIHAARMDRNSVDQENFDYAIERVIAGLQSRNNPLSPEERKLVAYHEAGHVIVSWMLKHTEPVIKISTVPRTHSPFGFTQKFPLDRKQRHNEELFDMMCALLGGRVAESLILNQVTTGAEDDLKNVTDLAYQQIVTYGMNKRVGPISFPLKKQGEMSKKPYSDKLAHDIDEEASLMIAKAHKVTGEILVENRDKLDTLASALMKKEVLNYEDLVNLIGQSPHGDKMKNYYSNQLSEGNDTGSCGDDVNIEEMTMNVFRLFDKVDESKVNMEAHLINDFGLDSVDIVEIVMAFEDKFHIEITDPEAESIFTMQQCVDLIKKKMDE